MLYSKLKSNNEGWKFWFNLNTIRLPVHISSHASNNRLLSTRFNVNDVDTSTILHPIFMDIRKIHFN